MRQSRRNLLKLSTMVGLTGAAHAAPNMGFFYRVTPTVTSGNDWHCSVKAMLRSSAGL